MVDLAPVLARRRWTWSCNLYEGFLHSGNGPFGSSRGKKIRKFSENDADIRAGRLHSVDEGSSQFISKVPLTAIESNGETNLRRRASLRIKKMSSSSFHDGTSRFPKLNDCAHFHYDNVELGQITLSMHEDPDHEEAILLAGQNGTCELTDNPFTIKVYSNGKVWLVKRCYEDFRVLDKQLHSCIYDRRFSQLVELPKGDSMIGNREGVRGMLSRYLGRFSQIAGDMINCGPVLNWMELDNHGNHVVASEESAINIPAVAAAHVTKRYMAQAPDEISLEVGDMISVIDMPPPVDTSWWRGKNGFEVGFFPRQCVELISDKIPPSVVNIMPRSPKPVLNKHGKLITFLRSFILARPTRRGLKQRGILRERVFSCDLGEHLLNCGTDVPQIVEACTEFIESRGIVDGIYRLSGVSSTVQWLRDEFDSEKIPDLTQYEKDIHCVSSVCKLYFRELPNPLLTYQLYKKFEEAATSNEERRLLKMHDTVQQLPPPHYRTLHFIIKHLAKMATYNAQTGMTTKNLAIVWAPNLLRSKELAIATAAAFMEIKIQATVVEYLIRKVDVIFNDKLFPDVPGRLMGQEMQRPKSLILSTPTKLLSLEEARARTASQGTEQDDKPKYIEVGGGPAALPKQYHTVIDLPLERKRASFSFKSKKSPGWKAFFSRAGSKDGKKKDGEGSLKGIGRSSLRSVRSVESLTSSNSSYDGQRSGDNNGSHKVIMRRNSVACVDSSSIKRASSHDSFFEVDAATIAAATEDFLASTSHLHNREDSEDEIFITEKKVERREAGKDVKDRRKSSPLWIDQSISSSESNMTSPKTPLLTPRDISMETKPKMMGEENLLEISARALMTNSAKLIPIVNGDDTDSGNKNEAEQMSPQAPVRRRTKALGMPSRRKIKSSPPMDLQLFGTAPPREVDIAEEEPSTKLWGRKGSVESPEGSKGTSVLEKLTRVMKTKNKVRRELSLGTEPGKQSRGTQNTAGEEGEHCDAAVNSQRMQDVDSQTTEDLADSDAMVGSLTRPRSLSARAHSNTDSDLFEDFLFPPEMKFNLDTVLSEYDHIMEKYSNRALTPEFDTSAEEGASGKRTSFPRAPLETEEFQPVPTFLDTLDAKYTQSLSDDESDKVNKQTVPCERSDPPFIAESSLARETPPISPMESARHNVTLPQGDEPLLSPEGSHSSEMCGQLESSTLGENEQSDEPLEGDLKFNFDILDRESDIIDFITLEAEEGERLNTNEEVWHDASDNILLEPALERLTKLDAAVSSETSDEFYHDVEQEDTSLSLDLGNPSLEEDLGLREMKFPPEDELDSAILGLKPGFGDLSPEIRASQATLASQYDNLDDNFSDRGVGCNVRTATPPPCDVPDSPFEVIESPFCTPSDENGDGDQGGYGLPLDDVVEHVIEL